MRYIQFHSESQLCPPAGSWSSCPGADPPPPAEVKLLRGPVSLQRHLPQAPAHSPATRRGEGRGLRPGLGSSREAGGPRAARHPSRPGGAQGREAAGVLTSSQEAGVWEGLGGQEQDSLRKCNSRSLEGKDARNTHGPRRRPWKFGQVPSPAPAGCTKHTSCVFFLLSFLSLLLMMSA